MSDISANFKLQLGNGNAEVELGKHYDHYNEDVMFRIRLYRYHDGEDKDCTVSRIGVDEMKRLIKQMQALVEIYEME